MSPTVWSEDNEFYAALGRAITNWQEVEGALCFLFRSALRHPDYANIAEVFFAVPNFRDKLRMVDAAVRFSMKKSPPFLASWNALYNKLRRRSERRNEIAHGYVWFMRKGDEGPIREYLGGATMLPSKMRETLEGGTNILMDKVKLTATAKSFDLLVIRIDQCRKEIELRLKRLEEVS